MATPPAASTASSRRARPNPIGLHRVTVAAVGDGRLDVAALEALDGTPVLDLKPLLRDER